MGNDYTILAASTLSGVPTETIRVWERRYSAVRPARLTNGRRAYSADEVARLTLLKDLVDHGLTISRIAGHPTRELKHLRDRTLESVSFKRDDTTSEFLEEIVNHLSAFRIEELAESLEKARLSVDVRRFIMNVAAPLLAEIGRRVEGGRLSIAQEHLVSALLRDHFGSLMRSTRPAPRGENFIFTTPEGDQHEFGILLAASLCVCRRLPIRYLGASLPLEELITATKRSQARFIVLGATRLALPHFSKKFRDYLEGLDAALPNDRRILLGGDLVNVAKKSKCRKITVFSNLEDFDRFLAKLSD